MYGYYDQATVCYISLLCDFTVLFFLFPNLQSGDDDFFAADLIVSFLFIEGFNPRIILRSERLSL